MGYFSDYAASSDNSYDVLTFDPSLLLFKYVNSDELENHEELQTKDIIETEDEFIQRIVENFMSDSSSVGYITVRFKYENAKAKKAVKDFLKISSFTRRQIDI